MENVGEEERAGKKEELEKEVWRCLNSVHDLLKRREILNQTLRQGWMELVSARYEMGPGRISHPLFSLKPQAGNAVVDISINSTGGEIGAVLKHDADLSGQGHVVFDLITDRSERERQGAAGPETMHSKFSKQKQFPQLRRRPVSILADDEKDELLEYSNLISDSDSEDDLKPLEVQKGNLQGFGAIVSPHLRSAQGTFCKALQLVMDLLNSQSDAVDAYSKVSSLQTDTCSLVVK